MTTLSRTLVAPLLALLLLVPLGSGAFASSSGAAVNRQAKKMAPLTIAITSTGTVWGKVTARYTVKGRTFSRSCSSAKCTLRIPRGAMLHLTQSPTDSTTWPFKDWQITVNHRTTTKMGNTVSVRARGPASVRAVYVVAGTTNSGSGSGSGSGYGSNWP